MSPLKTAYTWIIFFSFRSVILWLLIGNLTHLHACMLSCSVMSTLCDPMDCIPPGSSVHGIIPARILEWVAISFFRRSSQSRDWTHISHVFCIGRQILYHWGTWEVFDLFTCNVITGKEEHPSAILLFSIFLISFLLLFLSSFVTELFCIQ